MTGILTLSEERASGPERELIEESKRVYGVFKGVLSVLLACPPVAKPVRQLNEYLSLRPDSPLSRRQREMIGTVVYGLLGGGSCLGIHTEAVRRLTGDEHLDIRFAHRWHTYDLGSRTRALLGYARKLTLQPGMVEEADVDALRAAGLDEQAIWEATALIGFYNMIGRLELAAGLEPDRIPAWAQFPEATDDGRSD
ncbi:MAG TPA: peroxidase-related enzyme [Gaiellaceae bacterium]|nr:peroxidase-related enzyme [Gaiellaceae bacterium]